MTLRADPPGSLTPELLRVGHEEAPSGESRQRALAALGLGGAALTSATTAVATASVGATTGASALLGLAVKWTAVGLLAGTFVTGFAKRDAFFPDAGTPKSVSSVVTSSTPKSAPGSRDRMDPANVMQAPTKTIAAGTSRDDGTKERVHSSAAHRAALGPSPATGASEFSREEPAEATSILREVASLDLAKARLDAHDASGALAALAEHERSFGRGALGPEALVLSIEAFAMKGDLRRVRALADEFFSAYPRSPHANRVRELVGRGTIP